MHSPLTPGELLEALRGDGHELGDRGEVPVRVGDLGMAKIGGQREDLAVDVNALLVPTQEPTHGERVTKTMDVWPPCAAACGPAQATAHSAEGPLDGEAVK